VTAIEQGESSSADGPKHAAAAPEVKTRAPLRGAAFEDTRRALSTTIETPVAPGTLRAVVIENDGSEGAATIVPSSGLYVGRSGCGLSFPNDPFVSPVHALIRTHPEGIEICDLDSRNGIYVRLDTPTRLALGDAFLVGQQLLRLEALGPEAESNLDGAGVFTDVDGVRAFGSVVEPAWAKLVRLAIGEFVADSYLLADEVTTLGRDSGDIRFPGDAFLSRRHVQIERFESEHGIEALLTDLQSANGTYVRIRGSCVVPSGTFVRVGDEVLCLRND
jgi:pSer/pThr/pTyr-binding forkhead associated (FHA) protein